jgi:methionine-gamma-lyase
MGRPLVPPVVLASTFDFDDTGAMAGSVPAAGQIPDPDDPLYTRWSNPTARAVEERLAALEGAQGAWVTGSGMAAIHTALMVGHVHRAGPMLVQNEVYGGTSELVDGVFPLLGIQVHRAPLSELPAAAAALNPTTIFAELPSNPLLRIVDLPALRLAAPEATLVVDATFATPLNCRPLEHGADIVVHSASKYLGGHHDLVAGVVATNGEYLRLAWRLRKLFGPTLDPSACYRLWRGMETLAVRVRHQNASGSEMARRLAAHPSVLQVHHPSLPDHPDHALASRLLKAGGGVLSFEVAGSAGAVIDRLQCFKIAPSLGGPHSLVTWPSGVTHAGLSSAERQAAGLSDGLLRLALGLEDVDVLWADLVQALQAAGHSPGT